MAGASAEFAVHSETSGASPLEVALEAGDMLVATAGPVVPSTIATEVELLGAYNEVCADVAALYPVASC